MANAQIFISHSVAPKELAIVNAVADVIASRGALSIIAYREWNPNAVLPPHILSQLSSSHFIIAVITNTGHHIEWVNAEIAYSTKMNKPILILADEGINISSNYKVIRINRLDPIKTISEASNEIQSLISDKKIEELVTGLAIGGLILILLTSLKGK